MIIAVDFDGTIVDHRYPDIGNENPGAIDWLKAFQSYPNVRLMLWTMRSGKELQEAIDWCAARGLQFWSHNENPEQHTWTNSHKQYANIYIDDAAAGCPLIESKRMGGRPMVDWSKIGPAIESRLYTERKAS